MELLGRGDDCTAAKADKKGPSVGEDRWEHRAVNMRCTTCMWFVEKLSLVGSVGGKHIGRCRRHAPTLSGYPVVFGQDWCGEHKLDENRV